MRWTTFLINSLAVPLRQKQPADCPWQACNYLKLLATGYPEDFLFPWTLGFASPNYSGIAFIRISPSFVTPKSSQKTFKQNKKLENSH
jgi:hypothetical protein